MPGMFAWGKQCTGESSLIRRYGSTPRRALIAALFFFFASAAAAAAQEKSYDVPIGDSPQMGPQNAPVTIIEFIDFQ